MRRTIACFLNFGLVVMLISLPSCGGVQVVEKPSLKFEGLSIDRLRLDNPEFGLFLEVANPNPFSLPISHLEVELEINERPLARGEMTLPVSVPAHGSALLELKVHAQGGALWRAVGEMLRTPGGTVRYRLHGSAVATSLDLHFNFDQPGTSDLDTLLGRHRSAGDAR